VNFPGVGTIENVPSQSEKAEKRSQEIGRHKGKDEDVLPAKPNIKIESPDFRVN
jgi:hypothetical protein